MLEFFSWSLCRACHCYVAFWHGHSLGGVLGAGEGTCRSVVLFPAVACVFGGSLLRWSERDEVRWAESYGNSGHVYYSEHDRSTPSSATRHRAVEPTRYGRSVS
jgi:hypothetical protein